MLKAILLITSTLTSAVTTVPASSIRVIDGDTVILGQEHIRLLDIDAPETLKAHCPAEHEAGERASSELLAMLIVGHTVTVARADHRDRYGRTLARIFVDGKEAGAILMARGLALPYTPGFQAHRERIAHWCGPGEW